MELKDFIVTPILLFIVYALAYWIRPRVTDVNTRRYFIPALTVKIIGALAVGFIYQFYYGGGDTFVFFDRGSSIIYEAFMDSPFKGLKLILANGEFEPSTFNYANNIYHYKDESSYFVIKIAALLSLFTWNTYSGIAVLFAFISFSGVWVLYTSFYSYNRKLHLELALSVLFVPTVVFWGSGLLKDTITIGALGWSIYFIDQIFFRGGRVILFTILLIISCWIIFVIKKYILLCFIPAMIVWVFFAKYEKIRSKILRTMLMPLIIVFCVILGYLSIDTVVKEDNKYALENIAKTVKVTAYDIAFYTGKDAGSTYNLGELDGTFLGLLKLAPAAINVSLFRPYLWEVNNPLMLLSALESLFVLIFTLFIIIKLRITGISKNMNSLIISCLIFALVFAFAVGVSTYNFGTLSRYKIPFYPFYFSALFFLYDNSKSDRKLSFTESTE